MLKTLLAGTAALAIAGSSLVYAQQRNHGPGAPESGPGGYHRFSPEDRAAFTDARIAALKAGLRLTPEQDKHWAAYEAALRDIAKAHQDRQDRRVETQDGPRSRHGGNDRERAPWADRDQDPVAGMRRQAEMLTNAGAALKKLADAQEPLYASLDDSQKNRFHLLSRILTRSNRHFAQMRGPGGHGMQSMQEMHRRHHGGSDRSGMRGPEGRGGAGGPRGMMHHMDMHEDPEEHL